MDDSARLPPAANAARTSGTQFAQALSVLSSAFGWLMCTLAAGAVAAFASLVLALRPCWLILLLALPLTLVLKTCGCLQTRAAPPVAALGTLLAAFYATCLVAVARIAAAIGVPFGDAFSTGGIGLTLQVAVLGLDALAILVCVAAAFIAAAFAAWLARPTGSA